MCSRAFSSMCVYTLLLPAMFIRVDHFQKLYLFSIDIFIKVLTSISTVLKFSCNKILNFNCNYKFRYHTFTVKNYPIEKVNVNHYNGKKNNLLCHFASFYRWARRCTIQILRKLWWKQKQSYLHFIFNTFSFGNIIAFKFAFVKIRYFLINTKTNINSEIINVMLITHHT